MWADWTKCRSPSFKVALAVSGVGKRIPPTIPGGTHLPPRTGRALEGRSVRWADSPFAERVNEPDATYVGPRVSAEIRYLERTSQGKLRHAAFRQLRRTVGLQSARATGVRRTTYL